MSAKKTLHSYLENLLAEGRHHFTVKELEENLSMQSESITVGLSRLRKKGKLRMVRKGFGILFEGAREELDLSYYVDPMMNHLQADYYVGLLAAAGHWGAAHQAVMSSQVVADKIVSDIVFPKSRVQFIARQGGLISKAVVRVAGIGGYFNVSSPELTSLDLVRFPEKGGHLNNVATVLNDLVEKWDKRKLNSLCLDSLIPAATLQRLGYLLESILDRQREANIVEKALAKKRSVQSLLTRTIKKEGAKMSDYPYNERWKLYINTKVEID